MKKILQLFCLTLVLLVYSSCVPGGDYTEELGGGYFFRGEGKGENDILSHSPKGGEVPANVVSYTYNKDFIIAKQKPKEFDNAIYQNTPNYPNGRDTTYFWIIVHKQNLVLGPLDKPGYEAARSAHQVPHNLRLADNW